jgi:sec-independent protein translocase protein TatB
MFDLSLGKIAVIAVLALFLVGPDKLPAYAAKLGQWVRVARGMVDGAKERMREELGPDFDDVDWQRLDPRQYDPRRIVREALLEPVPRQTSSARTGSARPAEAYEVLEEPADQRTDAH